MARWQSLRYLEVDVNYSIIGLPMKHEHTSRCEKLLQVWMPEALADAISSAASKNFQSKSEYVRQGTLERLKADGIDPAQLAGAA